MNVDVEVLFGKPQKEIVPRLRDRIRRCQSVSLIAGFATAEGLEQIADPFLQDPARLDYLVVGAGACGRSYRRRGPPTARCRRRLGGRYT